MEEKLKELRMAMSREKEEREYVWDSFLLYFKPNFMSFIFKIS